MGNENNVLNEIKQLLSSNAGNKEMSSLGLQSSPELAAVISKLNRPKNAEDERLMSDSNMASTMFNGISEISRQQMGRRENSYNAFKLFPDLELAAQIVITSVLSPKDMSTSKLNYRLNNTQLPVAVCADVLEIIRKEMTETYMLDESLYDILHEALFSTGSYTFIVLPESAVDELINEGKVISTESARSAGLFTGSDFKTVRSLGILGNPHLAEEKTMPALERIFNSQATTAYDETLFVVRDNFEKASEKDDINIDAVIALAKDHTTVTDNYDFLKLPELISTASAIKLSEKIKNPLKIATESAGNKVSPGRLFEMIYKSAPADYVPFINVPSSMQLKRRSVGRPAILKPSSEAVIPVFLPGEYDNHIGYFIAVDIDGHPVTLDSTVNDFAQSISSMGVQDRAGAGASNLLTDRAKRNLISDNWVPQINRMAGIYAQVIERDLLERLSRGVMGKKNIEIKISNELSRTMLARAWAGRATRVVFIPGEYTTYFAYDYHRNGVGKSYLDDLSNVIGLRAMVLFSSVWARVRSSISTIDTHVTLDPRDSDPVKTIEMVKHLVAKSRQQYFPNGLQTVQDFTDWLHNAGIRITWEGHPSLPTTTITSESKNIEHVQPDDSLAEQLADMCYTRIGVTKEMVDGASTSDFAATVENHTVLFSRRTKVLGNVTRKHATRLVKSILSFDETIHQKLIEVLNRHQEQIIEGMTDEEKAILEENYVTYTKLMLQSIISSVVAELPEPDATKTASTKEKLDSYAEVLDTVLEYIYSEKFMTEEIAGELSGFVVPLKEAWKAELMRRYISNNDILPEVFDIISLDDEGKPSIRLNELVEDHVSKLMLSSMDLLKKMQRYRNKSDEDITNINPPESGNDYSSSSDDSTGSDGGDGMSGFDSMDDSMPQDADPELDPAVPADDAGGTGEPEAPAEDAPEAKPEE